ncbi:hypothetical protein ACHAXN_000977 [Cyclotella atomus]
MAEPPPPPLYDNNNEEQAPNAAAYPLAPAAAVGAPIISQAHLPSPTSRKAAPPRQTDHTYHDWAKHPPDDYAIRSSKKADNNFPAKLHRILSNPEHDHAICWQPHGRDKNALVSQVCPHYFGQTKFESFTRQPHHKTCYMHSQLIAALQKLSTWTTSLDASHEEIRAKPGENAASRGWRAQLLRNGLEASSASSSSSATSSS